MRYAFKARELDPDGSEMECVLKCFKADVVGEDEDVSQLIEAEAMTQMVAEDYAQQFNRLAASKGMSQHTIAFVPVSVVRVQNEEDGTEETYSIEPYGCATEFAWPSDYFPIIIDCPSLDLSLPLNTACALPYTGSFLVSTSSLTTTTGTMSSNRKSSARSAISPTIFRAACSSSMTYRAWELFTQTHRCVGAFTHRRVRASAHSRVGAFARRRNRASVHLRVGAFARRRSGASAPLIRLVWRRPMLGRVAQIHTIDGVGFGAGNLGEEGIQRFLRAHRHTLLCEQVRLVRSRASRCSAHSHSQLDVSERAPRSTLRASLRTSPRIHTSVRRLVSIAAGAALASRGPVGRRAGGQDTGGRGDPFEGGRGARRTRGIARGADGARRGRGRHGGDPATHPCAGACRGAPASMSAGGGFTDLESHLGYLSYCADSVQRTFRV